MARNHLEERLAVIRNQQAIYKQKLNILQKEEIKILTDLGVLKNDE